MIRWLRDAVLVCVLALALMVASCLEGCAPGRTAQDAARAGVISLAGATRLVYALCEQEVLEVATAPNATREKMARAIKLGEACESGITTAQKELQAGAADVERAPYRAACRSARASLALAGVVAALESDGAQVPWEVGQAITIASAASQWCSP